MAVDSPLRIEPRRFIADQVRELAVVEAILSAIGDGVHSETEIARRTSLGRLKLSRLLYHLAWLELIGRRLPIFSSLAMRRERYYLRDPLLRFYYHVLVPYESLIRQGRNPSSRRALRTVLNALIADDVFPELCEDWIWSEAVRGTLGFVPQSVSGYCEDELSRSGSSDIVAVSTMDKRLFIAGTRWGSRPVSRRMLSDLRERAQRVPHATDSEWTVEYGFFSSTGFTPTATSAAPRWTMRLVDLANMEKGLVEITQRRQALRRK